MTRPTVLPEFLYRGVRESMYRANPRLLNPKKPGSEIATVFQRDGSVPRTRGSDPRDLGAIRDYSITNTVLLHQLRQAGYETPGISTTPHFENARKYALYVESTGFIYRIATERLGASGVRAYIVADFVPVPSVPEDEEVLLIAEDGGTLPPEIIDDVIEVRR